MSKGATFKTRIPLDTANNRKKITVPESGFFQIVDSSDPAVQVLIGIDRDAGIAAQFTLQRTGEITEADGFDRFYITNTAQAGAWVDIVCSASRGDFSVKKGSQGILEDIINPIDISKPSIFKALAKKTIVNGAAALKIITGAATTREVFIQNNDTAGNGVWLGDSLVDAVNGKGTFIAAGATVILTTTANVYARNNSGADVDLNLSYTAD